MKTQYTVPGPFRSYENAFAHLCQFTDYERMAKIRYSQNAYNLQRMRQLMQAVNNPQNSLRCIHIAGTKGKGSTALMLTAILSKAGYKTGLYTSPHLTDLRERIQIWRSRANNHIHGPHKEIISKNDFKYGLNRILASIKGLNINPTFFELITAIGFLHFAIKKTDIAVIEVGLGGRLDATNIITPAANIITRIDFDHMNKLGRTLSQIASEKAGIIKPGVPVITFSQKTTADKVIRSIAKSHKAPLYLAKISRHHLPVHGAHQSENWSLALKTVELMNRRKIIHIGTSAIKSALKRLELPGRMEQVATRPAIIIDSAHNAVSFKATCQTALNLKYRTVILIFALSADKEAGKISRLASELADIIILTKTNHPRLLPPQKLIRYFPERPNKTILIEPNHINALTAARRLAPEDGLILITGSFYLAGAIKQALESGPAPR
jgi:dihydrofolate synthase/folylpolyglutamate synthase